MDGESARRLRTIDQPDLSLRSLGDGISLRPSIGAPDVRIGAAGGALYSPASNAGQGKLRLECVKKAAKIDETLNPPPSADSECHP